MQEFSKTRIEYNVRYNWARRDLEYWGELMEITIILRNGELTNRDDAAASGDVGSRFLFEDGKIPSPTAASKKTSGLLTSVRY